MDKAKIIIYTKSWCGYCSAAKNLLKSAGAKYKEIDVTTNVTTEKEMQQRSKRRTVPQIFINGQAIGGYTELVSLLR